MKLVLRLLGESWRSLVVASLLGGVSGVANVGLLAIVHRALQHTGNAPTQLVWLFAAACSLALIARVASQVFLVHMSQRQISRLRLGLCERILTSPLRQLEEIGMHRMIASLTGDVQVVSMAFNSVPTLLVNAIILFCGGVYLGTLSWPLLVAAVVFTLLGFASYWATARVARHYMREGREAQDGLMKHIRSLIQGVKELKMHHARRQEFVSGMLIPAEQAVRRNQFMSSWIQDAAIAWGRLLFLIAIALLLFVWARLVPVEPHILTGYTLAIFFLMTPLERVVACLPLLSRAAVSVQKIERLGLMLDRTAAEPATIAAVPAWNLIELVGVTHSYRREGHEGGFQLGPVDLTIRPGEIVFVAGGNGSGKTTLIKLLTGLYVPASGQILLNDQPVEAENREGYRQLFTAVFDDAMVFDGLWGLGDVDLDARAQRLLSELRLDHVVEVTNGVFSTTDLSRGQRKRLALLTAYLEDRGVYVFDEWAADQDPTFKRIFYDELLPDLKRRGRTVVAITHDDRYFGVADRLIKLDEGRLIETSPLLTPDGVTVDRV